MSNKDDKSLILANRGAELIGSASGAIVGFLIGGPIAAGAGAALGTSISHAFKDVAHRVLSDREQVRISAAANIAAEAIESMLKSGSNVRQDTFFDPQNGSPSAGEEIFEGVLLKAKSEYEEKKVGHMGLFFANLAFDDSCPGHEANHLLQVAEDLVYSQFVLLSIFGPSNKCSLRSSEFSDKEEESIPPAQLNLLQQTYALFQRGLVRFNVEENGNSQFMFDPHAINPSKVSLSAAGLRFYRLFGLAEVQDADRVKIAGAL